MKKETGLSKKRVFVAMSGGVDSSVAAALLKKQNYDVVGAHMKCYNLDGCAEQDAEDARRAAEVLDIPFYVFDFEKEYKERVVNYMIDGYRRGITPNPDVMCNRRIKFGVFLERALSLGADYIATGHYVRKSEIRNPKSETISKSKILNHKRVLNLKNLNLGFVSNFDIRASNFVLKAAKDKNKDQSYFLWTLTQKQLKHCLFPIGEYTKPRVRMLAKKFGLPNAEKKDSQGICFLGQVSLPDFLKKYIKTKKGDVVLAPPCHSDPPVSGEESPKVVGIHNGTQFYTIGQRHLRITDYKSGVGNRPDQKPLYVADKNTRDNTLIVAEGSDHPALYKKEILLTNVNFVNPQHSDILPFLAEPTGFRQNVGMLWVWSRVRYRQPLAKAKLVTCHMSHITYKLVFDKPQKFVAPGQSAVFYNLKGELLGGGIIKSTR